jgi:hypothetical protein
MFSYNDDVRIDGQGTFVSGVPGIGVVYKYEGGFLSTFAPTSFGPDLTQNRLHSEYLNPGTQYGSNLDPSPYGATGWNRFRPGKPTADLGVVLGEAKDIPRMLKTSAKGFRDLWKSMGGHSTQFGPKKVADHWLNTQFGWLPFLNDVRKFHKTWQNADRKMERIRSNNGRWVKSGGTVDTQTSSEVLASSATNTAHWPALASYLYADPSKTGSHSVSRTESRRVWFEGSFKYYIPNVNSVEWEMKALRVLYGASVNPALLWELTPWSWLVDWFSNAGDVIANLDDNLAENLAARYAYVMQTHEITGEVNSTVRLKYGTLQGTWRFPVTWKSRVGASPFGFGLTSSDLSARQWSILGALGITHSKAQF